MKRRLIVTSTALAIGLVAVPAMASWAVKGSGNASAIASSLTAPGAPTVNGTVTATSVPLQWTAASGLSGTIKYHVERRLDAGSTWTDVCNSSDASPISDTSCSDGGVSAGKDYRYRVTAQINNWHKQGGESAKISTPSGSTFAITLVERSAGNKKVKFSGTGATSGGSITITICKVNTFPCPSSPSQVAGTSSYSVSANGNWGPSSQDSANLNDNTNYWAQAVQTGPAATSASFLFTVTDL